VSFGYVEKSRSGRVFGGVMPKTAEGESLMVPDLRDCHVVEVNRNVPRSRSEKLFA